MHCHRREAGVRINGLMEAPVEIRYAGVVIGRAQEVRTADDASVFFLPGKDPMPVGTVLRLRSGARETSARVLRAVESPDPAIAGMQVRLLGESEEVAPDFIPAPPQSKTAPKSGTPTPAVEVDVGLMQVELAKHAPAMASESAPVPEAVPVTVGSSLTGALERAAAATPAEPAQPEGDGAGATAATPPETAAAAPEPAAEPTLESATTVPSPTVSEESASPAAASEPGQDGAESRAESDNGDRAEDAAENGSAAKDMPTARPIAGPNSRRKTKRRRYQRQ
jgi:hypothetical protein